jgi:MFS transporter, FHS family, glucose/mannose:H+ symporter
METHNTVRSRLVRWLYVGSVLTGAGTTLLGCMLPALIAQWHMNDARAGVLFAAQFSGAALGALLVGHDYFRSLVRGYLLLIGSGLSLALFADYSPVMLFLIFGFGLGLTMTATSLLTGRMFSERRGAVLSLLNAYWGLGAVLCPGLVSLWTRRWAPEKLFFALVISAGITFLLLMNARRPGGFTESADLIGSGVRPWPTRPILNLAFVAFLYVGVETSVSGWMMAYVHRSVTLGSAWPPIAVSSFWIALICGRAVTPAVLRRISETGLLTASVAGALGSVLLLLLNRTPFGMVLSAAASGLALGPIYPLCLAQILTLSNDSPRVKWVFASAGFGGALLPWLTGRLSAFDGSLSAGLIVPLLTLGIMLVLQLRLTRLTVAKTKDRLDEPTNSVRSMWRLRFARYFRRRSRHQPLPKMRSTRDGHGLAGTIGKATRLL